MAQQNNPQANAPLPPVVMDADQLQQVLGAVGAGHQGPRLKISTFESGDGVDWMNWRSNFEIVARANGWNAAVQRRMAASSMRGIAKLLTKGIPLDDMGAQVAPAAGLLDAYQARFVTEGASDLARAEFRQAQQREDESVLEWHGRMRHLFGQAYPEIPAADVENNRDLRDTFLLGLRDIAARQDCYKARPQTYQACLELASSITASHKVLAAQMTGMGPSPADVKQEPTNQELTPITPALNSLVQAARPRSSSKPGAPEECYFCGKKGHMKRRCRLWISAGKQLLGEGGRERMSERFSARARAGYRGARGRDRRDPPPRRHSPDGRALQIVSLTDYGYDRYDRSGGWDYEGDWSEN